MDDLISRHAAIDAICDCVCGEQKHKCDGIGCRYNGALMEVPHKTGRHFPRIAELLKQMKEED